MDKLINLLLRHPLGYFRFIIKNGGFIKYAIFLVRKAIMKRHAYMLRIRLEDFSKSNMEIDKIYFLTGKKYWHQTVFCIYSLLLFSQKSITPIIIDDGSLNEKWRQKIKNQIPGIIIYSEKYIESILDEVLPKEKFPFLRNKRITYKHLRKITDIHILPGKWKLVLDSDMLFFKQPDALIKWMENPTVCCLLQETKTHYGYSMSLMNNLAKTKVIENLNVGLVGIDSSEINWEMLEYWGKTLEKEEGSSYYLEQGLIAMIASNYKMINVLDSTEYKVFPSEEEIRNYSNTLQHYVDISKNSYYGFSWRYIFSNFKYKKNELN